MNKLKYLISIMLYHFQAHVDTLIKFDKQSNAIIGHTDAGKTSISRALMWALYNRPTRVNDEYMMHGATHSFVTVTFSDGTEITRGRRDKQNYYILKQGEESKTFEGFGFEVPPEVVDAHGMYQVDFDDSGNKASLNLSMQLEPVFMFDDTASRRSKLLGKISGADRADGALGVASGWLKEARSTRSALKKKVTGLDVELSQYDFLQTMGDKIEELTLLVNKGIITEKLCDELVGDAARLAELEVSRKELENTISFEQGIITAQEYIKELEILTTLKDSIYLTLSTYIESVNEHAYMQRIIAKSEDIIGLDTLIVNVENTIKLRDVLIDTQSEYLRFKSELDKAYEQINLGNKLANIDALLDKLSNSVDILKEVQASYSDYLKQAKLLKLGEDYINSTVAKIQENDIKINQNVSTFDVCPVCNNKINGGHTHE